jgi:16S rRNA C967 or C1407 C5-methylase (RsmB/RsmF family)/NOL1/NOP2/fmu family ribosome biogenesis protein
MKPLSSAGANSPLPSDFVQACEMAWGLELASTRLQALGQQAETSIRLHPKRRLPLPDLEAVPWHPNGRYVPKRPVFTLDPAFHAGAYYVQEASSMVLWPLLNQLPKPEFAIDLAAAPGGKSTLLLDWMNEEGWLLANDPIPNRALALQDNLKKWGYSNLLQSNANPEQLALHMPGEADLVLLDAPCSGEGMFRKDAYAREQWSLNLRASCRDLQQQILPNAVELLKPGGHLIYSTCTFHEAENQGHGLLLRQLGLQPVPLELPREYGFEMVPGNLGWAAYPGQIRGEGFYVSVWKKEGELHRNLEKVELKGSTAGLLDTYLPAGKNWKIIEYKGNWYGLPKPLPACWSSIPRLQLLGVCLGKTEKGRIIPDPHLAFIEGSMAPMLELNTDEALRYLKGMLPEFRAMNAPWIIAGYRGMGLGWLKTAGHRFNNAYPHPWRIRMDLPRHQTQSEPMQFWV